MALVPSLEAEGGGRLRRYGTPLRLARLPGRSSAARLGGNETSGSGSERKEEEADRKEGEAAARANGNAGRSVDMAFSEEVLRGMCR